MKKIAIRIVQRIWILAVLLSPLANAASVLVIQSYHSEYEWDKSYLGAISAELGDKVTVETFEMNTKRLPQSEYAAMADKAMTAYHRSKPDIVVLGDDNALHYLYPKLYDEPISIVFLGVNSNPRQLFSQYSGQAKVTGILELPLFVKNIGEIKKILAQRVLKIWVMFDSGVTSRIAGAYIENQYQMIRQSLGIELEVHLIETEEKWQHLIRQAKEQGVNAILIGLYHTLVDQNQNNIPADRVLSWSNQHSQVPLFGFWDFSVGKGKTAGGVVLFGEVQGRQAGEIINHILAGKSADTIPIQIGSQGRPVYSESEFRRWGLPAPQEWERID